MINPPHKIGRVDREVLHGADEAVKAPTALVLTPRGTNLVVSRMEDHLVSLYPTAKFEAHKSSGGGAKANWNKGIAGAYDQLISSKAISSDAKAPGSQNPAARGLLAKLGALTKSEPVSHEKDLVQDEAGQGLLADDGIATDPAQALPNPPAEPLIAALSHQDFEIPD
jgi:hypothetical protein